MRLKSLLIFGAAAALNSTSALARNGEPEDYVFEHVNVVPMSANMVLRDRYVAVRNRVIVAIGRQGKQGKYPGAQRIDGRGMYLMPGLADMHTHTRMPPQDFFDLNLAAGVTTVFNMGLGDGGGQFDHVALRRDVASGAVDGPRYLISGAQLDGDNVKSLTDVDRALNEASDRKYDAVKVHGDLPPAIYDAIITGARKRGLRIRGHGQHMMPLAETLRMDSVEHVEEILYLSTDRKFGEKAKFGEEKNGNIDNFLTSYHDNLERLQDNKYRASLVREIARSKVFWDPTIVIYEAIPKYLDDDEFARLARDERLSYLPRSVRGEVLDKSKNEYRAGLAPVFSKFLSSIGDKSTLKEHFDKNVGLLLKLTKEMHGAGVPLLTGSDAFGAPVPGFALHQEMELMVRAGISPYETLRAATINSARFLGESRQAGTIEVGKRADFILLGHNPLTDIRNAADVQGVFVNGQWHSAARLKEMLAQVARHSAAD
ncbi:MAG: amidohydrolase family protein [Sphingobium sp.]|nr:amidohydrolase family protein [Sphingobium sp.]